MALHHFSITHLEQTPSVGAMEGDCGAGFGGIIHFGIRLSLWGTVHVGAKVAVAKLLAMNSCGEMKLRDFSDIMGRVAVG